MLLFFRIGIGICVAGLIIYMLFYGWRPRAVEKRMLIIRKSWYSLLFVGAAVVIFTRPASIITNWKAYMIVGIVFAAVDLFVYLSMYIKKVGNSEFERQIQHIQESTDLVVDNNHKLTSYIHFIKNEGIDLYDGSPNAYLKGFMGMTEKWAESSRMAAEFYPFEDLEDKNKVMELVSKKRLQEKFLSKLDEEKPCFFGKNKHVLIPVKLMSGGAYIVHLSSENVLSETDFLLLSALLSTYDLVFRVQAGANEERESRVLEKGVMTASSDYNKVNVKPQVGLPLFALSPRTKQLLEESDRVIKEYKK